MTYVVLLALVGFLGGAFGALVGLGGGVFIIPGLALFLDVPIHTAVAASLVAVVATSTTAAAAHTREDLTNIRLGMTLETMTVIGALGGGMAGTILSKGVLSAIFGVVMILVSGYLMVRRRVEASVVEEHEVGLLGDAYYDRFLDRRVVYRPERLWAGLSASFVAGGVSGLLGGGGGFLKVPVLVAAMKVPPRAAVSTSSFMIGITACVGALLYFARGVVDMAVVVPVVLGVMPGAYLGAKVALRVKSSVLIGALAVVLFLLAVQMLLSVAGISVR
jgi:uncharacterized protein